MGGPEVAGRGYNLCMKVWSKLGCFALGIGLAGVPGVAQEHHRRGYKPLPELAVVTIHVEKSANGKPLENAAVVFHAKREGHDDGSLEVKTNPDGDAKIDLLEVGSDVNLQIIADGYATYASQFTLDSATKDLTVKMLKPRAQVSAYADGGDRPSQRALGVQEPPHNGPRVKDVGVVGGAFSGTLRDPAGARIPGGIVQIQQTVLSSSGTATMSGVPSASGISIGDGSTPEPAKAQTAPLVHAMVSSDATGNFRRKNLPAGHYRVEISAPGFQTLVYKDVSLTNGDDHVFTKPLVPSTPGTDSQTGTQTQ